MSQRSPGNEVPARFERMSITDPIAVALTEDLQAEYVIRYGGRDDTPYQPEEFAAPLGAFFVGYLGDRPVATGAWRFRPDVAALGCTRAAEVKRMYVAAAVRRAGLGRALLLHLEGDARAAGADVMVLETGEVQPEAIALYLAMGYATVEGFGYYRDDPRVRYFGRAL